MIKLIIFFLLIFGTAGYAEVNKPKQKVKDKLYKVEEGIHEKLRQGPEEEPPDTYRPYKPERSEKPKELKNEKKNSLTNEKSSRN